MEKTKALFKFATQILNYASIDFEEHWFSKYHKIIVCVFNNFLVLLKINHLALHCIDEIFLNILSIQLQNLVITQRHFSMIVNKNHIIEQSVYRLVDMFVCIDMRYNLIPGRVGNETNFSYKSKQSDSGDLPPPRTTGMGKVVENLICVYFRRGRLCIVYLIIIQLE